MKWARNACVHTLDEIVNFVTIINMVHVLDRVYTGWGKKKYNPTENVISLSIHNIFAPYFKGL